MTDDALVAHTVAVKEIEAALREDLDGPERETTQMVLRQAVALRRALEHWIVTRAMQAPRPQKAG